MILIDEITEALDQGECIIGVFLDISKAFDTVDHHVSLQKLALCGIQYIMLKWFKAYFANRVQWIQLSTAIMMVWNQWEK